MEQFLQTPTRLREQLVFQITSEMGDRLIEKWSFLNYHQKHFRRIVIIHLIIKVLRVQYECYEGAIGL